MDDLLKKIEILTVERDLARRCCSEWLHANDMDRDPPSEVIRLSSEWRRLDDERFLKLVRLP
jgi:hypothetical protein